MKRNTKCVCLVSETSQLKTDFIILLTDKKRTKDNIKDHIFSQTLPDFLLLL